MKQKNFWICMGLLLLSTCFLFWPLIWGAFNEAPRYLEWDVPEQYWPDLSYLCQALRQVELPLWNPYDRAGYPFYADPQAGIYHPVNWMICALAGQSPGLGWAEFRVVLGFFLAGSFGLLWLRRLGLPWGAALVGAVVFQTAPFMRHNFELNLTTAMAYLPLMCWAADRAVVERRIHDGVLLALSIALCAWVGSPPALFLSLLFVALYCGYRLAGQIREHGKPALFRGLCVLAVAFVITLGLTAAVVVPGLRLSSHSVQAGRDFADLADGGLELNDLWAFLWPRSGNHLYVGLVALALLLLPLLPSRLRQRFTTSSPQTFTGQLSLRWFFVGMGLTGIGLSLGDHTPLLRVWIEAVPGASWFRLPHRYEAWLGPSCAALTAFGLNWLSLPLPAEWAKRHHRLVLWVASISMCFGFLWLLIWPGLGPAMVLLGTGIVLFGMLLSKWNTIHMVVSLLLSVLILLDVSQTLPTYRHTVAGSHPESLDAAEAILKRVSETDQRFRYFDEFGISCRSGTRLNQRDFRGYQDPLLLKSYERVLSSLQSSPQLAEQFNVRYILSGPHFIHGWNRHFLPPASVLLQRPGAKDLGMGVIELPHPLPVAYFVPEAQVKPVASRQDALAEVIKVAPARVAFLENQFWFSPFLASESLRPSVQRSKKNSTQGRSSGTEVEDFHLDRDQLSFKINAPGPGVVVVNEAFYPEWIAWIDGTKVPIYRANGLVRAIPITAGEHHVEMRFMPWDGTPLRVLLLATLLSCLAVLVFPKLRKYKKQ